LKDFSITGKDQVDIKSDSALVPLLRNVIAAKPAKPSARQPHASYLMAWLPNNTEYNLLN